MFSEQRGQGGTFRQLLLDQRIAYQIAVVVEQYHPLLEVGHPPEQGAITPSALQKSGHILCTYRSGYLDKAENHQIHFIEHGEHVLLDVFLTEEGAESTGKLWFVERGAYQTQVVAYEKKVVVFTVPADQCLERLLCMLIQLFHTSIS
ncbi:hypothetical protein SDC9_102228 [bioreactor metagenome]|uniref:Uncharacterized protein n=1 Tax=bioreactor metagenome TaxID=1076179 RepID=A0A645ASY4_9ZZZZ